MIEEITAGISLFASAFGAATFLPLQSEIVLLALAHEAVLPTLALWMLSTTGNTLGALLNWWLGIHLERFAHKNWFPIKPQALTAAKLRYETWGKWSLLFAWVPFIGDPLTLLAGVFGTQLRWFIPLVAFGKGLRYALLLALL